MLFSKPCIPYLEKADLDKDCLNMDYLSRVSSFQGKSRLNEAPRIRECLGFRSDLPPPSLRTTACYQIISVCAAKFARRASCRGPEIPKP